MQGHIEIAATGPVRLVSEAFRIRADLANAILKSFDLICGGSSRRHVIPVGWASGPRGRKDRTWRPTTIDASVADRAGRDRHGASAPDATSLARFHDLALPQLDAAYNFARYLCRDADAAQDIVQDAFLKAFRNFDAYRGGDLRAWLFAIVRNCHHDWICARRRAGRVEVEPVAQGDGDRSFDQEIEAVASEEDTPDIALQRKSEAEQVRAVLLGLPETSREILVLRELEFLSYREIAAVTDVPIGTVMSRLARARREFAQAWARCGSDERAGDGF